MKITEEKIRRQDAKKKHQISARESYHRRKHDPATRAKRKQWEEQNKDRHRLQALASYHRRKDKKVLSRQENSGRSDNS